jgi:hypothetical protein
MRRDLYWLNYVLDGERCAVVIEACDIVLARRAAGDIAGLFMGGDPLDTESRRKIPQAYVGRLLRPAELKELERALALPEKKGPAKSIPAKSAARVRAGTETGQGRGRGSFHDQLGWKPATR